MKIFRFAKDLSQYLAIKRKEGIGFIPTMGALHPGHISLIEASIEENGVTVCSIFVNPTQFNDPKDLDKYPRTTEKDIDLLLNAGCNVLYLPSVEDVYPDGTNNLEYIDLSPLDSILEGASRPGHFQGVAVVVKRLFEIVNATRAYFGQKDYQQVLVIKRLAQLMNNGPEIKTCPIIREDNGLAMSSRNVRLDEKQRKDAGKIYEALRYVSSQYIKLPNSELIKNAREIINKIADSKTDYIKICDRNTLAEINADNIGEAVCLAAVYVGGVRLIDNILLQQD